MMKLLNAFSLNMMHGFNSNVQFLTITRAQAQVLGQSLGFESCVGHADTAAVFSEQLGLEVPANRATVSLVRGEMALIGQYRGPRLEEGTTALPAGACIDWTLVLVDHQENEDFPGQGSSIPGQLMRALGPEAYLGYRKAA